MVLFLLFNGISTFLSYLMPNPSLLKNSSGSISSTVGRDKEVHAFPKGTSSNVNILAWFKFKLVYYDVVASCVRQYATGIAPSLNMKK